MDVPAGDRTVATGDAAAAAEGQAYVRHELRTPLAVIQPLLGMLLDGSAGPLSEKQRGYVGMLERNVDRLAAMIASVVETGWLEVAAIPAEVVPVIVADLVRETVADVRASLQSTPRIDVRPADSVPPLRGDPHRLGRALRNVLVNACTYTAPDGRVGINIQLGPRGDHVTIVVTDTGYGVEPDELTRVFELGFRGAGARALGVQGLGLGLPVALAIVEGNGGTITLEGAAPQGTRVAIQLPVAAA
jgi:signal transduction histidine kinase